MIQLSCHYCERPARRTVVLRTAATEGHDVHEQLLCDAHDAIVAALASVTVLARRPLPVDHGDDRGVVFSLASDGRPTPTEPQRRRSLSGRRAP